MTQLSLASVLASLLAPVLVLAAAPAAKPVSASKPPATVVTPGRALGFEPGTDRELVSYEQLVTYLRAVDQASDRVEMREVGKSPEGRPMFAAFFSAPENIVRLDELRAINERLALDPAIPPAERERLVHDGRVFLLAGLSMHSSEIGPSQALPALAYELATTQDPDMLRYLASMVLMVVPSQNPDGMDMVVDYYRKTKGTPYEGTRMPGLYHEYVGHDNNRDYVTLTQADTRVVNRLYSTEWYPQVLIEKHQMGATGPRYYVPPNHDPIAENVDEPLWSWMGVFGYAMARDMGHDGLKGVVTHWEFDNYWSGSTETSMWKNVVSLLSELASARVASPVYVEPTELHVEGKGLSEYKKGVNMPDPWPGGWWRIGDLVKYELSSMRSLIKTSATNRRELLTLRNDLCKKAVEDGRSIPPYYYVLPRRQHDRGALGEVVRLLVEHGVRVSELSAPVTIDGRIYEAGDVVVPLSQPYRPFVKEVMERQHYPERHYSPDGELIKPYDITSWSLPVQYGLTMTEVDTRSTALESHLRPAATEPPARPAVSRQTWGLAFSADDNDSFRIAWDAFGRGLAVARLRRPMTLGGASLPTGSFVVSGKTTDLAALAEHAEVPPTLLGAAPSVPAVKLRRPRVALVETWYHDVDAGWTRFLLDQYHVPFTLLRPADVAKGLDRFDVLVLPDSDSNVLAKGRYKDQDNEWVVAEFPPEYQKGLGKKGIQELVDFVERGGTVVAWGESIGLLTDDLEVKRKGEDEPEKVGLPVRNVTEARAKKGLFVPGSWLRLAVDPDQPLTWGMPRDAGAFSRGNPVLQTTLPRPDTDRRVVATYPDEELLVSGYIEKQELLRNTPAVVWVRKGKGQLALMAFSPQGRASTPATYKLLFNALLLPPVD